MADLWRRTVLSFAQGVMDLNDLLSLRRPWRRAVRVEGRSVYWVPARSEEAKP